MREARAKNAAVRITNKTSDMPALQSSGGVKCDHDCSLEVGDGRVDALTAS
jgi:hypothetical protein